MPGVNFEWVPDWDWHGLPLGWIALIGGCFALAAIYEYAPCQISSLPVIGTLYDLGKSLGGTPVSC